MSRILVALGAVSFLILSAPTWSDDSPSDRPNATNSQLMKRCVADQKAKNSSASADDVKKTCRDQVKAYRDHPSVTTPPAATPPG